ncbi:MAG TPA: hypothetical protein VFA26_02540, partial [Gemmataceae bacterium]|nr:hypothetical protein [Gemmataceae bacterium]
MLRIRYFAAAAAAVALWAAPLRAEDKLIASLKKGTPDLHSIGALAFGPEGILFVGDAIGGAVFAIDTGDREPCKETDPLQVEGLDGKFASLLGIEAKQLQINGMAVNPISTRVYFSVSRGKGPEAKPVLLRVDRKGKAEEVSLRDVPFAKAMLSDAPAPDARGGFGGRQPLRPMAITQLAYIKGNVYVAGLSSEEWSSAFRSIPFPFKDAEKGASVGIFHGSHGRFETNAPIRTFLPIDINGEANLLAAYTCTPLVKIPLKELKPGAKVKGVTVAELGNRNT